MNRRQYIRQYIEFQYKELSARQIASEATRRLHPIENSAWALRCWWLTIGWHDVEDAPGDARCVARRSRGRIRDTLSRADRNRLASAIRMVIRRSNKKRSRPDTVYVFGRFRQRRDLDQAWQALIASSASGDAA